VNTTVMHGFDVVVDGTLQPEIVAPDRSGSHMIAPPAIVRDCCPGLTATRPPWTHVMDALDVRTGGISG
jgi:hypothetical protein